MAEIQLTDALTGRTDAYTLAVIDWDALIDSGVNPFSGAINAPTVSDTHKTYYYIDNVPITDDIITGLADSMLTVGTEQNYKDNFLRESSATYLPEYTGETVVWFWKEPVQNSEALEAGGTFVPNRLYYKSETACRLFRTDAGGLIGGSIGVYNNGAQTAALCCIGAAQTGYVGGFYQQGLAGYCPRFDGDNIIDFSTHPTRTQPTCSVGYDIAPTGQPLPTPTRLHAQMVITVINNVQYLGLAAVLMDALGKPERLSVLLIPSWFWGKYTVDGTTPETKPNYYGLDASPSGGDGSYTYTNIEITIPTAENPFSGVLHDGHGVHVYSISTGIYDEVCGTLWGDGTFSDALWKKWQNYKFNPIAAICGCHKLPYQLNPRGTFQQVDCRASGCPLTTTTSAYYVNGQTTVDYDCGSVNFVKYFGNFMDYEPYTSISLYLPFCGWTSVPADRVMGGVLYLSYRCDIITGNVAAYIRCTDQTGQQTYTTTITGNAAVSIPVTGNDNGTGSVLGAVTAGLGIAAAGILTGGSGAIVAGAAAAGLGAQTGRHLLQQSGQVSGNVSIINQLQPFVFVSMPIDAYSDLWRQLHGIRSMLPVKIGDMAGTGHTVFSDVHADRIACTTAEQAEIENILKSGVIL